MIKLDSEVLSCVITSLRKDNFTLDGFFSLCIMNMVAKASEMVKYNLTQEDYDSETGDLHRNDSVRPNHYNMRRKFFNKMFAIIKFKKDQTIRWEVFKAMYNATFGPLSEGVNPKRWGSNVDLL